MNFADSRSWAFSAASWALACTTFSSALVNSFFEPVAFAGGPLGVVGSNGAGVDEPDELELAFGGGEAAFCRILIGVFAFIFALAFAATVFG